MMADTLSFTAKVDSTWHWLSWYSETLLSAHFWVSARSMPCGKMNIYHPSWSTWIWNYLHENEVLKWKAPMYFSPQGVAYRLTFADICPHYSPPQRVIVLFPGYPPSPYRSPYWTCNILHVSDHIPQYVAIACCYVMTLGYLMLRAIPGIHETNALREVLWQRVGKFLLESTITLSEWFPESHLPA